MTDEKIEQIITQSNPIDGQRPAQFAIFLSKGQVPFSTNDLAGLYGDYLSGNSNYKGIWSKEIEKFNSLFSTFSTLQKQDKNVILCIVYPTENELLWNGKGTNIIKSNRGLYLSKYIQETNKNNEEFSLCIIVQFGYKDDERLFSSIKQRKLVSEQEEEEFTRSLLKSVLQDEASFTLTDKLLPPQIIKDLWSYYRINSEKLNTKYGFVAGDVSIFNGDSNKAKDLKRLYEKEFVPIFDKFKDSCLNKQDKLVFLSFIYDKYQVQLYRLKDNSFSFDTIPITTGAKWLMSRVPIDTRMIIKALYVEKD